MHIPSVVAARSGLLAVWRGSIASRIGVVGLVLAVGVTRDGNIWDIW
jgi:hypothetical protein